MTTMSVKDASGATQSVAKVVDTGPLASSASLSTTSATDSASTNATTTAYAASLVVKASAGTAWDVRSG